MLFDAASNFDLGGTRLKEDQEPPGRAERINKLIDKCFQKLFWVLGSQDTVREADDLPERSELMIRMGAVGLVIGTSSGRGDGATSDAGGGGRAPDSQRTSSRR